MGKGQVVGHLEEEMAEDDMKGDHTVLPMSPGKQRVWEQGEARDRAKKRR